MKKTALLITALFAFANIFAQDCNLNEEARRHVARAKGYMAAAEKEEDYLDVFNEYKAALQSAPNCPDICYNLAHCAEMLCKLNSKNCDVAIHWYKKYLEINPNAPDRNEIIDKIYEVEAKKEMYEKKERTEKEQKFKKETFVGIWERTPIASCDKGRIFEYITIDIVDDKFVVRFFHRLGRIANSSWACQLREIRVTMVSFSDETIFCESSGDICHSYNQIRISKYNELSLSSKENCSSDGDSWTNNWTIIYRKVNAMDGKIIDF